jgi:hypothetical protein
MGAANLVSGAGVNWSRWRTDEADIGGAENKVGGGEALRPLQGAEPRTAQDKRSSSLLAQLPARSSAPRASLSASLLVARLLAPISTPMEAQPGCLIAGISG